MKLLLFVLVVLCSPFGYGQLDSEDRYMEKLLIGEWLANSVCAKSPEFSGVETICFVKKTVDDTEGFYIYNVPWYRIDFSKSGKYKGKRAFKCGTGRTIKDYNPKGKWSIEDGYLIIETRKFEILYISEERMVLKR